ncbi:class I SAM-dependent methyltransferase [bacterium]|nr:class I SAM-dependent methyltransferase [bacterium]
MTKKIQAKEKYNRASKHYDLFETPMEKLLFSKLRKSVLPSVVGNVLEVGVGTGKNLPYYSDKVNLIGVDFSSGMLEKAQQQLATLTLSDVELLEMDAQDLKFDENSFDTTISTFVFCTVPDPLRGLKNVYRVLKPGGKAIFIEHMKTDYWPVNLFLKLMNFFSIRMLGTSMIRETEKNIIEAGFKVNSVVRHIFGVVRVITATKN